MTEMQQLMRPIFDKIRRMQKEVASEIQAKKIKAASELRQLATASG
jgi:hypothetical protein